MRHLPFALAASLLFFAPAASGLRADPPPAPVPAAPAGEKAKAITVVNISARLVKATTRAARSIRLLGTARTSDDVPTYDPAALDRRLRCWERAGHVETLSAPHITTYPGQKATISMLKPFSYISDYDVELTNLASPVVANPVIQTIQEGLNLECMGSLAPRGVSLSADLAWAEVKRPIREFETSLVSGGSKVKIQTHEVRIRRAARTMELAPGRAALLADFLPVSGEGEHVLLVWIEARAVTDPGLAMIEEKVAEAVR
jgi:hypothetical protein